MRREELFGLPVTPLPDLATAMRLIDRALATGSGLLVTFVNPYAWRIARARPDFAAMLAGFDLVLPDGIGVVKALAWTRGIAAARLSFDASSLYLPVLDRLDRDRRRLFVIGGAPASALARAAVAAGMDPSAVSYFETSEQAAPAVVAEIRPGDLVLVKGSRGTRTDVVADALVAELG